MLLLQIITMLHVYANFGQNKQKLFILYAYLMLLLGGSIIMLLLQIITMLHVYVNYSQNKQKLFILYAYLKLLLGGYVCCYSRQSCGYFSPINGNNHFALMEEVAMITLIQRCHKGSHLTLSFLLPPVY